MVEVVSSGGANVLLRVPQGGDDVLYRCCVRYKSLHRNNELTIGNYRYISETVAPLLGQFLLSLELARLSVDEVQDVLQNYAVAELDDDKVMSFKMRDLRPRHLYGDSPLFDDHFTKVYCDDLKQRILLEIKPKWLYRGDSQFCRNCTHNIVKKRHIPYCYSLVVDDPDHIATILNSTGIIYPTDFITTLIRYFHRNDNVLKKLYELQESLEKNTPLQSVSTINDVTPQLLLNMTLRDVTCFIGWNGQDPNSLNVNLIDVDKKPIEKWEHWVQTHRKLCNIINKVNHT